MLSSFVSTWQYLLASWKGDWKLQKQAVTQLRNNFVRLPLPACLVLNLFFMIIATSIVLYHAEFSQEFLQFSCIAHLLPFLLGSLAYYQYRFGWQALWNSMPLRYIPLWLQNFWQLTGIALVSVTQSAILYFLAIGIEPYVMPLAWQGSVNSTAVMMEDYLRFVVLWFYGLALFQFMTLPLWKKGYNLYMTALERPGCTISYKELVIEIMFTTCQSSFNIFWNVPLQLILRDMLGIRIHFIHIIMAVVELAVLNTTVTVKYTLLHQLMHEVSALNDMCHIEHHLCKGVYPNTSGVGLWESYLGGGGSGLLFVHYACANIPYATLQMFYTAANLIGHTMWPMQQGMNWHTLHHIGNSDSYGGNKLSGNDIENSKTVRKFQAKFNQISWFGRYKGFTDIMNGMFIVGIGMFFHYVLGVGIGHIDWSQADWKFNHEVFVKPGFRMTEIPSF